MHSLFYIGGLCIPLLALLLQNFLKSVISKTRSVPGPRIARLTRLWYFNRVARGTWHTDNIALHQKYGPVVRVAPGWFSLSGPPDKQVYGIGSRFPKSDWYQAWKHPDPARWTVFPDQDIRRHAETRRRFQSLYSLSALLSYEPYVDHCIDLLLARMAESARAGGAAVDMVHWFQCFAFDVMGDMNYSQRFGFLDRGEDVAGAMQALGAVLWHSTLVGIYHWLHPYLYPIMERIPGSGAAGRTYLMGFVGQRIAARREARAKLSKGGAAVTPPPSADSGAPRDFLDKLMDQHDQNPEKVTPHHMFMMGTSNIFAGSDTTAISLSGILWHLITTPKCMAELRKEVDSQPRTQGRITFKTANTSMPYLQAVIKEALRLHPAAGLPLWRVVPEGGSVVSGQYFEAGSVVGINSWVAHYDRSVYGDDAGVFRPERWIEAAKEDPGRLRRMEANYIPFGLGARTCLGRHISTLEMCKLVPELVSKYDFELAMPRSDWKAKAYWFVKPDKLLVRVLPRQV